MVMGLVFVLMKDIVVTACTERFGMDRTLFFAAFTRKQFWFPFELFVAGIAEPFCMVLFLVMTIHTLFYHDHKKTFAY